MRLDANSSKKAFAKRADRGPLRNLLNMMFFDVHTQLGRTVNLSITILIVVSVLVSMTGTMPDLEQIWVERVHQFEMIVTFVFAMEFVLRCYAARSARAYIFSFYGIVDMLAILPMLLIGDPNVAIRMLRILRLLKLVRYLRALRLFISSMRDTMEMLAMVLGSIGLGAILAGNLIYTIEPETFKSAFDGAWWGIVTMTTVGYGDVVPHTLAGRAVAVCLMVVGICMFAAVTGVVSIKIARAVHHGVKCQSCEKSMAPEFHYCPHCGYKQIDENEEEINPEGNRKQ
ncbi:potassium channel protein [Mariprofundus sp. NF]|uniref:ion transporter n=1 Tax=Mariprofundus sp. NF TaxID=2608716 RepID=UPI0015A0A686|nr:ion transporter [Mariprofundus sp. NF]NWF39350.1 potassium channel protein [Mariprofundus sp. NF]